MEKSNIGYLPSMGSARETIKTILEFYQEERKDLRFKSFFEEIFGQRSEKTMSLTQRTLVNYGLIMETEDYVYKITPLGQEWLKDPTYEALVDILDEHVDYIRELLLELREHACVGKELLKTAERKYGIVLNRSDISRRMQILKSAGLVKMNRRKQYSLTEEGAKYLQKNSKYKPANQKAIADSTVFKETPKIYQVETNKENDNQEVPEILYHYCSIEEFLQIMKNKKLRFWDLCTLQGTAAAEKIIGRIREQAQKKKDMSEFEGERTFQYHTLNREQTKGVFNSFLEEVFKNVRDLENPMNFVMRLMAETKMSYRWNPHAGDEAGILVGLDFTKMRQANQSNGLLELQKVCKLDDSEKVQNMIGECASYLVMRFEENSIRRDWEKNRQISEALWSKIYDIYKSIATDQYDEKEWRLIFRQTQSRIQDLASGEFDLKVRDGKIVPCLDVEADENLPIRKVVLGPSCKMSVEEVRRWMTICGFQMREIKVDKMQ